MSRPTIANEKGLTPSQVQVKRIWTAFWILAVFTILELACGFTIYLLQKGDPSYYLILFIKGVITILTFGKAFYIISIFMHLGDEIRTLVMSLVIPATLFVWFITAFLWDGNSFRVLRNTNAHTHPPMEQTAPGEVPPAPAKAPSTKPLD